MQFAHLPHAQFFSSNLALRIFRRTYVSVGVQPLVRPKNVERLLNKRPNPCPSRLGVRAIHPAIIDIHGIHTQASPFTHMANLSSSATKTIGVAVVGVGLVGGEFVDQLLALAQPHPFELVSLSTSKTHLTAPAGCALQLSEAGWREDLAKAPGTLTAAELLAVLAPRVTPGTRAVLIDNTSAETVAALYPDFLRAGVHVVTPNKKAFSASADLYARILAASLESGSRFLNEATVGAGLPIISTLKDLVATGDKVRLSGVHCGLRILTMYMRRLQRLKESSLGHSATSSMSFPPVARTVPPSPQLSKPHAKRATRYATPPIRSSRRCSHPPRNLTLLTTSTAPTSRANSPFSPGSCPSFTRTCPTATRASLPRRSCPPSSAQPRTARTSSLGSPSSTTSSRRCARRPQKRAQCSGLWEL